MKLNLAELPKTRLSEAVSRRVARGEKLELLVYEYAPGARFGVHQHDSEQLTIVLSGTLVFTFDDGEVPVSAGEAIIIPGGKAHGAFVPHDVAETRTYNVFTPVRGELPQG